jgi:tetratricopeptide (TPR) repeat protein
MMQKIYIILFTATALFLIYFGTQAITMPRDEKITVFNLSLNDETKGNYTEAANKLMKIYDKNKDNYLINLRLGWLNYLKGSQDQSKKYYRIAINLSKQKVVEPYLGLTLPLAALEEWDEVRNTYQTILKLDPGSYIANLRLGQIYLNAADYNNARNYLEKAFNVYPSEYEVNLSLGWTYYYLGNRQKAKELLTSALMLNPNDSLAEQGYNLVK